MWCPSAALVTHFPYRPGKCLSVTFECSGTYYVRERKHRPQKYEKWVTLGHWGTSRFVLISVT